MIKGKYYIYDNAIIQVKRNLGICVFYIVIKNLDTERENITRYWSGGSLDINILPKLKQLSFEEVVARLL